MKKIIIIISLALLAVSAVLLTMDLKTVKPLDNASSVADSELKDTTAMEKNDTSAISLPDTAGVSDVIPAPPVQE